MKVKFGSPFGNTPHPFISLLEGKLDGSFSRAGGSGFLFLEGGKSYYYGGKVHRLRGEASPVHPSLGLIPASCTQHPHVD